MEPELVWVDVCACVRADGERLSSSLHHVGMVGGAVCHPPLPGHYAANIN